METLRRAIAVGITNEEPMQKDSSKDDDDLDQYDILMSLARNTDPDFVEFEVDGDDDDDDDVNDEAGAPPPLTMADWTDALRKNHTVTCLRLKNLYMTEEEAVTLLGPTLKHSQSIQALELHDCCQTREQRDEEDRDSDAHGVFAAVAMALFYNRSITCLHIRSGGFAWSDALDSAVYSSLGFLVGAASSQLTELRLCHTPMDALAAAAIAAGLKMGTAAVQVLDLTGNGLTDDAVVELAVGLADNSTVEYLCLDFNDFGDRGVTALATKVLSQRQEGDITATTGSRLRELHLFANRCSAMGAEQLAAALTVNRTLQTLILSLNRIGDGGATALARALTVNTTLTKLWFPSNSITAKGIYSWAAFMPLMRGLDELNVGLLLDDSAADALVGSLKHNVRLSVLHVEKAAGALSPPWQEVQDEVEHDAAAAAAASRTSIRTPEDDMDFYLRLNRSGRRLLLRKGDNSAEEHKNKKDDDDDDDDDKNKNKVPDGLWANILAGTVDRNTEQSPSSPSSAIPDVLHYLLCEKPDLLINCCGYSSQVD